MRIGFGCGIRVITGSAAIVTSKKSFKYGVSWLLNQLTSLQGWWVLLTVGSSVVLLAQTWLSPSGYSRACQLYSTLQRVEQDNHRLGEKINKLRRRLHALSTRKQVQEQVVRDELGYIRPGDKLVYIQAR